LKNIYADQTIADQILNLKFSEASLLHLPFLTQTDLPDTLNQPNSPPEH